METRTLKDELDELKDLIRGIDRHQLELVNIFKGLLENATRPSGASTPSSRVSFWIEQNTSRPCHKLEPSTSLSIEPADQKQSNVSKVKPSYENISEDKPAGTNISEPQTPAKSVSIVDPSTEPTPEVAPPSNPAPEVVPPPVKTPEVVPPSKPAPEVVPPSNPAPEVVPPILNPEAKSEACPDVSPTAQPLRQQHLYICSNCNAIFKKINKMTDPSMPLTVRKKKRAYRVLYCGKCAMPFADLIEFLNHSNYCKG